MDINTTDACPLQCVCGSDEICICYSVPVFVYLKQDDVTKVVVADEEVRFGGVVRCLVCDRFWIVDEEPEMSVWPAWEFGR